MDIDSKKLGFVELESIIPLRRSKSKKREPAKYTADQITGLSSETLKRRYAKYVKQLSERREGMKLKHALAIAEGK